MTVPHTAYALSGAGLAAGMLLASPGVALAAWPASGHGAARITAAGMPVVDGLLAGSSGASVRLDWSTATIVAGRPVSGYEVVRYAAGSGTAVTVGEGCSGVVTGTGCTETGVPDGLWQYAVRAVQGRWTGALSARSTVSVLTTVTPGSVVTTFPVAGRKYGPNTWAKDCAGFCGTATASSGSTLSRVEVSIRQADGRYWTGSGFTATAEQFVTVTGDLGDWRLPFAFGGFPATDSAYVVHVVATDSSGRVTETTSGFSIDAKTPNAVDVQTVNSGVAGRVEIGDTLELTYDEPIDPASVRSGWDGTSLAITVRHTAGTLTFLAGTTVLPLGTVTLTGAAFQKPGDLSATLTATGNGFVVRITGLENGLQARDLPLGAMRWAAGDVRDLLGNSVAGKQATEQGGNDVDF